MSFRTTEQLKIFLKSKTEMDADGRFFDAMNYIDDLERIISKNTSLRIDAEAHSEKLNKEATLLKEELRKERKAVDGLIESINVFEKRNKNRTNEWDLFQVRKLARETQAQRKVVL